MTAYCRQPFVTINIMANSDRQPDVQMQKDQKQKHKTRNWAAFGLRNACRG